MPFHLEVNKAVAEARAREICTWHEGNWRFGAGMDEFAVVNCAPGEQRALMTMGAGSCTIVLIHKAPGVGALGHFTTLGHHGAEIGDAVRQMVAVLGDATDLKIVIAACQISISGEGGDKFQKEARDSLAARGDNVTFAWPGYNPAIAEDASACFYLPHEERAYLTSNAPKEYKTAGSPFRKSHITAHPFLYEHLQPPPKRQ
jgi:hypothetical protein